MVSIFISHSRNDKWFIEPLAQALKQMGIEPILLELETPIPHPLPEAIENNIKRSSAVFVLITPNVVDNQTTRDNVLWEVATAHTLKKPIHVLKDKKSTLPMMIPYVTTYIEFDMHRKEEVKHAIERATIVAKKIKEEEAVGAAFALILLLATPFILSAFLPEKRECPNCGYKVDRDAIYCPKCGSKL